MNRAGFLVVAAAGLVWAGTALIAQTPPPAAPGTTPAGAPGMGGRGFGGRGRGPLGGAAAGFVVSPEKDKTPPDLPADFKPGGVLIISKTSGFREEAAIQASDVAQSVIAKDRGFPYFV